MKENFNVLDGATDPFVLIDGTTVDAFIFLMLEFGTPLELSLVGVFEKGEKIRGSRKEVELPLHRDGEYSQKLAEVQGGEYVEKEGIDVVGLFCLKESDSKTIIEVDGKRTEFILELGQALIFDNHKCLHGREGKVGDRILIRMWVKRFGEEK